MLKLLFTIVIFFPQLLLSQSQSTIVAVMVNGMPVEISKDTLKIKSADNLLLLLDTLVDGVKYHYNMTTDKGEIVGNKIVSSSLSIISYQDFKSGEYKFNILPINSDSKHLDKPTLTIIAENSFFRTWSFIPLIVIYLLLLFGGALYFVFLSNFRGKERMVELRSDWTNKLHNDIGADLSSVSLRMDTLKRKLESLDPKVRQGVEKAYNTLKSIQKKLRFIFDLVDPNKNSLLLMLADLYDFSKENYEMKNIALQYVNNLKESDVKGIDIGRINKLYLAIKEAVNNSVKYSKATAASLQINSQRDGIKIEIIDNGVGFDPEAEYLGNGVRSLKEFSKDGFMDVTIQSEATKGTIVSFFVPYL